MNWILKLTARITAWQLFKVYPKNPIERGELWEDWKKQMTEFIRYKKA